MMTTSQNGSSEKKLIRHSVWCKCVRPECKDDLEWYRWLVWHAKHCRPRPIVDVHLPEFEGANE